MARAKTVDSMTTFLALRQELVEAGVLAPAGASLTFTKDWLFASPSAASSVVLGRNSNGRTEWRDEAGQTLKEIQTKDVE